MSIRPQPRPKFNPGRIVATPGALEAIRASGQSAEIFVGAHLEGYWGRDLCEEDRLLNEAALTDGSRILSVYRTLRGRRLYVITEAADDLGGRASTCLLLAEEY